MQSQGTRAVPRLRYVLNRTPICGLFKSVSLCNTATRQMFFHNGRFHTLKDALRFYVQRNTDPAKWYTKDSHGNADKFKRSAGRAAREHRHDRRTDEPLIAKQANVRYGRNRTSTTLPLS